MLSPFLKIPESPKARQGPCQGTLRSHFESSTHAHRFLNIEACALIMQGFRQTLESMQDDWLFELQEHARTVSSAAPVSTAPLISCPIPTTTTPATELSPTIQRNQKSSDHSNSSIDMGVLEMQSFVR